MTELIGDGSCPDTEPHGSCHPSFPWRNHGDAIGARCIKRYDVTTVLSEAESSPFLSTALQTWFTIAHLSTSSLLPPFCFWFSNFVIFDISYFSSSRLILPPHSIMYFDKDESVFGRKFSVDRERLKFSPSNKCVERDVGIPQVFSISSFILQCTPFLSLSVYICWIREWRKEQFEKINK